MIGTVGETKDEYLGSTAGMTFKNNLWTSKPKEKVSREFENSNIYSDPQFINSDYNLEIDPSRITLSTLLGYANNFGLTATSPGHDSASIEYISQYDFTGKKRPASGTDIGALEL